MPWWITFPVRFLVFMNMCRKYSNALMISSIFIKSPVLVMGIHSHRSLLFSTSFSRFWSFTVITQSLMFLSSNSQLEPPYLLIHVLAAWKTYFWRSALGGIESWLGCIQLCHRHDQYKIFWWHNISFLVYLFHSFVVLTLN